MFNELDLIEKEVAVAEEVKTSEREIILYNDDVNTFDYVIDSLVEICNHEAHQAEQCALIVHYTGKCSVKKGTYKRLKPLCTSLLDRGLTAEIS
jgi:ATP-dependent Clp protease adaptor protein ClpS